MCVSCGCTDKKTTSTLEGKTGRPDLPGGGYSGVGGSPVKQGK